MTDANLRSIRIFSHKKKTIKEFLQPMIEQVFGGGGGGGVGCASFLRQFFRATVVLCRVFFSIHRCLFWVEFANICVFFSVYYVYFIKKSNSVLGKKFS